VDDPRLADHAVGIELEMTELVEQRQRALVQGRTAEANDLQREIDALQLELVETAEELSSDAPHAEVHGARIASA